MHTFGETGAGVPAFLAKLWRLVEDPETNHLIYWNKDGRSFIIQNQAQFARELLPLNYKHNNMASFIRQLNMYGFHKITSIDNGGLKFDRDEMEFSHPCFKRGHPYLLEHIKRKIATTKTQIDDKGLIKPEAVNKVLSEVKAMRGRQDSLDSRFSVMKQENEALWREIATLRQKHMKQQQIVNKLIQFLVTIVQPSRGNMTGVKRHFQLMINDVPQSSKMRKKSENESEGPVIHELTEELLDEVADDSDLLISSSPSILSPHNDMSNPLSSDMADDVSPEGSSSSNCDQTKQSQSMSSLFYNYDSNLSDDLSNSFNNYQNNIADEIIFNIREVPDDGNNIDNNYMEDNVLNTPLVKKEIARARREQKLRLKRQKEKKQRLLQSCVSKIKKEIPSTLTSARQQRRQQQNSLLATVSSGGNEIIPPIKIKIEKDPIDPLMFLNCSDEQSLDPALISPLSAAEMQEATAGISEIGQNQQQQQQQIEVENDQVNQNEIFNPSEEIITSDIPSDLFEDSTMIGDINLASGSYNQNIDLKAAVAAATAVATAAANSATNNKSNNDGKVINDNTGGITSQSIPSTTTSLVVAGNPKDQSHINNDSNNDVNGLSLIATTAPIPSSSSAAASTSSGIAVKNNSNGKNLTLAKYNNPKYANDDIMRLSTAEEVTTHLDNVQEDLDNLRDLLRGDGYSLDANTLLGNTTPTNRFVLSSDGDYFLKLFSDSDVLAPYGLTISNDYPAGGDKKGSELMSYQPYYADLADILDIDSDTLPKTTTDNENYDDKLKLLETPNSVLNTPYRE